ncbi:transport protein [Hydrogenophaga taeniospiralis CCUG 15921]|uniref:Transport protein n=1 Tax=Hydrogenophaga taeniospiralis CCUG 15921 TaxID=1281780 RepID=A0A9X4P0N7_9BURK|nr:BON domain-containing protein [Hydrogenophaga taeniospiralis]MDG5977745.1 transport protein [Hydrogenophaga taeniospiralis CCUG 15921]
MNQTQQQPRRSRLAAIALTSVLLGVTVSACAPLMMGGAAVGSALVATDRRTSGAQLDDQTIELRAANRLRDQMGTRARLDVTSYNRRVLLTGEVVSARDKELAGQVVAQVANVAGVVNELDVANSPTLRERTADSLLTGRVKAAMLDAKDLSANSFKVVTNRGTVFLMGRVTQREADRATEIVRNTSSVQRVVRVLEIISDEELSRLQPQSAPAK